MVWRTSAAAVEEALSLGAWGYVLKSRRGPLAALAGRSSGRAICQQGIGPQWVRSRERHVRGLKRCFRSKGGDQRADCRDLSRSREAESRVAASPPLQACRDKESSLDADVGTVKTNRGREDKAEIDSKVVVGPRIQSGDDLSPDEKTGAEFPRH